MEVLIAIAAVAAAFGLGYWLGHRTVAGIKSDLEDAKAQLKRLREKV